MKSYADIMREEIEKWIGRQLTTAESSTIEWLAGWDSETRKNVMVLLRDAHRNGQRERKVE